MLRKTALLVFDGFPNFCHYLHQRRPSTFELPECLRGSPEEDVVEEEEEEEEEEDFKVGFVVHLNTHKRYCKV